MLLDIEKIIEQMPVIDFFTESKRDVSAVEELEAIGVGLAYREGEIREGATHFVYAVGAKDSENKELWAVPVKGAPREPVNEVWVSTARRLLSYNDNEAHPLANKLDYAPNATPPRPAVVRALTNAVTKHNGTGSSLPTVIPR